MKIGFVNFGCRVNQAETDALINSLSEYDASYAEHALQADVVVINTCAVTEKAQTDIEKYIRNLHSKKAGIKVVATGCLAELMKNKLDGADIVVHNSAKQNLLELMGLKRAKMKQKLSNTIHTRAYLKIQDGCDQFCTYCIIPFLRGTPVSRNVKDVMEEFKTLIDEGYKEIVLTGINVGLYSSGGHNLPSLLQMLAGIEGQQRIRLSSLYLNDLTEELIDVIDKAGGKICHYFHISLQSASDDILKAMGRNYTYDKFAEVVGKIRAKFPTAGITADIICGFPGETVEIFESSAEKLLISGLSWLHVFPYSKRPGTVAAGMPMQVSVGEKKARAAHLREISEHLKAEGAKKLAGKALSVLCEKGAKGHADNFYMVKLPKDTMENTFIEVTVSSYKNGMLE